ncbi:uncharacterized protein FIBRA_09543 [Fibroporia radiculosa]|uniref:Uncharacterized protein n=1 Tax=Fibroporia radiculosa TaxID=599839 RepID=J7RI11_9APHY|nr:uncharacterized protein FIBRA_09543 [Fibroporia radiculosa]CCM07202.1 predicted protein [Fibroporia radiculosa]
MPLSVGIGYVPIADSYTLVINSALLSMFNPDNSLVPLTNLGTYKNDVLNGNSERQIWRGG